MLVGIGLLLCAILCCGVLAWMKKKESSKCKQMIASIVLGLLLGGIGKGCMKLFPNLESSLFWLNLISDWFLALLKLLILPMVFFAFLSLKGRLKDGKGYLKVVGAALATFSVLAAISALVGFFAGLFYKLPIIHFAKNSAEKGRLDELIKLQKDVNFSSFKTLFEGVIPTNILTAWSEAKDFILPLFVFMILLIAIALTMCSKKHPKEMKVVKSGIDALNTLFEQMKKMIMGCLPFLLFFIVARMVTFFPLSSITEMFTLLLVFYLAAVVLVVIHSLVLSVKGYSPLDYFKKVWKVLCFAFVAESSAATYPINVEVQEKDLGVHPVVSNTVSSLGLSMGQNGCAALFSSFVLTIIAVNQGVNVYQPLFIIKLIFVVVLSSFLVSLVGGGATYATLIVLAFFSFPIEGMAMLIVAEPLIDRMRTLVNVSGIMTTATFVDRTIRIQQSERDGEKAENLTE